MDGTIPTRAAAGQRAHDGVRPFSKGDGVISIEHPGLEGVGAEACGPVSHAPDPLGERFAEARARELASAAAFADEEAWLLKETEKGRRWAEEERAREEREERARADRREATMRANLDRVNALMREEREAQSFAAFADPEAASVDAEAREREEAEWLAIAEHTLVAVRGTLGQWSRDSETRFEQTEPATVNEEGDAKRLGARGWALSRLGMCGSHRDLGYVVEQIRLEVGDAVLGCWVADAIELHRDGRSARRQLYSTKARRKLFRSYVLWRCGSFGPLRDYAGSPSTLRVRGVRRCPQRLLARVLAVGGVPWSRATTTRDANEAHSSRLWRRIRLPQDVAPAEERAGASGQVVSRYVMHLPVPHLPTKRAAKMVSLAGAMSSSTRTLSETSMEWVARHAVRLAMSAVDMGLGPAARAAAPPA